MTGRERLLSLLNSRPVDRLSWTTLVDDTTRSTMPNNVREMSPFDFYRHIGCDILQFGNYGLADSDRVIPPCQLRQPEVESKVYTDSRGMVAHETRTEWGTLTASFKHGHPVKHAVESLEELWILKNLWLHSRYEETNGMEESYARVDAMIGNDGIYVPTVGPSPVQQLLEFDMGAETFYGLLQDHPGEVERLLDTMHACRLQEYETLARRTPAAAIIPVENTSSTFISPSVYEKFSLPQIRDFVDIMHKHKKKAILHMCGHLRDLLPVIRETGLDGINGLTPPPFGDTPFEHTLDVLGEDCVIFGGVLDGSVFHRPSTTTDEIWDALDGVYSLRMMKANLLLWVAADGLPTPLERFLAVRDWMEKTKLLQLPMP